MKKLAVVLALLLPTVALAATHTAKVKEGGTVRVCVPTLTAVALIDGDGNIAIETTAERKKPGARCGRFRATVPPGTYTLETYEPTYKGCGTWSSNCRTVKNNARTIGTVEVVAKKSK